MSDVRGPMAIPRSQLGPNEEAGDLDMEVESLTNMVSAKERWIKILITRFDSAAPAFRDTSR